MKKIPVIFEVRGRKVALDSELAIFFGVGVKTLRQAVKRNLLRFPKSFRFELTRKEKNDIVGTYDQFKNLKYSTVGPNVFTIDGILMLPFVLRSPMAIQASIAITDLFVQLRRNADSHKETRGWHDDFCKSLNKVDKDFGKVFQGLAQ